MMVVPRTLDSRALDYLREYLDEGGQLSRVLASLPLETGRVWSYLHPTVAPDTAYQFTSGGITPPGPIREGVQAITTPSRPDIVWLADNFLRSRPDALLICEDASATPTDPYIQADRESHFLFYDEEVYRIVSPGIRHQALRERTIRRARSYRFLAILTTGDGTINHLVNRSQLTPAQLATLVRHTERIIIGAYDYEGYLIWESRPSPGA